MLRTHPAIETCLYKVFIIYPFAAVCFYGSHKIGDISSDGHSKQNMYMVFPSTYGQRFCFLAGDNTGDIWCKVPRQSLVIKLSRCFTAKHGMDGDLRICIWHRNVAPMGLVLFRFLLLPKYRPDGADLMVSYHSIKMPRWDWFVVSFLLLPKCRPAVLYKVCKIKPFGLRVGKSYSNDPRHYSFWQRPSGWKFRKKFGTVILFFVEGSLLPRILM